ncbi:hypothetical protein AMTR_s00027p00232650 [Amborella trichopoda]|uniref:Uncharacterized protein n=1 Tax=Amborella trichopoda TaxID=13333 RepID=W1PSY4_AMBTC|nr:hypothetical protein AMTR_s00027p00232650 [Amborella trichopoda]
MESEVSDASSQLSNVPYDNHEAYDHDMPEYEAPLPPPSPPPPPEPDMQHLDLEIIFDAPNLYFPPIFFKTRLQEILMQAGEPLPQYVVREASRTKKDAEKFAAREALVFINLLPSLANTLFDIVRDNEALRLHQAELLTALDATHATFGKAKRELLDVRNAMQALS